MDPSAYDDIRLVRIYGQHGQAEYVVQARRAVPTGWQFELQFVNDNRHITLGTFDAWSEGMEAAMEVAAVGAERFNHDVLGHLSNP